jgi:diketogulonate reductase-like aldo/keto reductase
METIPGFFYGTAWKEERTEALTRQALDAGFRAIDTANQRRHYFEAGVGAAISASGIAREELFLQTKFTFQRGQDHRLPYDPAAPIAAQVAQSFESSLEHLQTSYVDSYVLHGPTRGEGLVDDDWEAWSAMSQLQRAGRARLIGISNVSLEQLTTLHREAEIKPAFVQNRCYARTGWDGPIRAFCRTHGIGYQGFSLLTANQRELASPSMAAIAKRAGSSVTVAQVVFRFAMQVGMIPLTGSSDAAHLAADLACLRLDLAPDELITVLEISRI